MPEARKVQMVVVRSEQGASEPKGKIKSGEMTMYQAARDHSIDPGAKRNLGEIGWVTPGEGQPALDEAPSHWLRKRSPARSRRPRAGTCCA